MLARRTTGPRAERPVRLLRAPVAQDQARVPELAGVRLDEYVLRHLLDPAELGGAAEGLAQPARAAARREAELAAGVVAELGQVDRHGAAAWRRQLVAAAQLRQRAGEPA